MKLNVKNTFFVGLVFLSISMFWQVYDSIVSKILAGTFGLDNAVRGIVMALDNIVALFMLPLFGMLSDKSKKCRFGRRTPYIAVGTVLSALTFIAVGVSADSGSLVAFMITLCFTLIFMSVYRSPAVALMPDVTVKPLRSKANAVINLMGALGGLISLGLIAVMVKEESRYLPLFAVVAGLMLVFLVLFLLLVKEPKLNALREEDERRFNIVDDGTDENEGTEKLGKAKTKSMIFLLASVFLWFMAYNAVTSSFSVYAQEVWGIKDGSFSLPLMVAQVAAIAMFIPVGLIASRIGRKKTILIGVAVMFVAFFAAFFVGSNLFGIKIDLSEGSVFADPMFYVMAVFFAMCGVGWATINVNSYPMVVEMSKGSTVGKFTGYYYTASMAGQIATPFLSGLLMDAVGMESLFMYSAVFMLLAFATMFFVTHGDSKPLPKKSKLESFDAD
ncbi:MAG: MFS transporter [Bacillota bacterium]|nr:MAG: MFS transporter [Bacillota bacterium]